MGLSRNIRTYGGIKDEKSKGDTEEVWPALLDDKVEEEQIERVGEREEETHTERGDLPESFEEIGLDEKLHTAIKELGYEEPTLIQAATIPALLGGDDVMGQAKTGTGKTAAFGLPGLQKTDPSKDTVQAVILCPTRELCQQVSKEMTKFSKYSGHRVLAVYGGQPMKVQLDGLQEFPHVLVGTPGRMIDHIRRGTVDLSEVRYLVLDEADEMLDMGFIDDIRYIVSQTPKQRQSALFSATFPVTIRRLARASMHDPRVIHTSGKRLTVESVTQIFYEVPAPRKYAALRTLLDHEEIDQAVVFCRTRWETDLLHRKLQDSGYEVRAIHGDLPQSTRTRVMEDFRAGKLDLLVATDVAARGLDISGVSHVINYHLPQDPEVYVHRIGRTARMGTEGYAMSLVAPEDYPQLVNIQEKADSHIEQRELPDPAEINARRREKFAKAVMEKINPEGLDDFRKAAKELIANEETDMESLVAYFLKTEFERAFPKAELEKDDGHPFGETGAAPGFVRVHLDAGRERGIEEEAMKAAVLEATGLTEDQLNVFTFLDRATFVEIPEEGAADALTKLDTLRVGDINVRGTPARPRRDKKGKGGRDRDRDRKGGRGGRDRKGGRGRDRDDRGGRDRKGGRGRKRRDGDAGGDDRPRAAGKDGDGDGEGGGRKRRRRRRRGKGDGGGSGGGEGGGGGE